MRAGRNQYAPMQGVPALRQAIAAKYQRFYGRRYDPETEVTVTSGGTEALFDAVAAVVHPGDEVIVFEPCYDSYVPAIELSGGVPVDRLAGLSRLRDRLGRRARGDHEPDAHDRDQLAAQPDGGGADAARTSVELTAIVDGTDMLVLSDEVYEHIIFDGVRHESMARHDALAARSFIVGSFGKTYHTTGWKVGYAVAPAPLTRRVPEGPPVRHLLDQHAGAARASPTSSRPSAGSPSWRRSTRPSATCSSKLMQGSRFKPLPCRGSYFQLMDYSSDHQRAGHGLCGPADQGARRRVDSDVAVPVHADRSPGAAVLLREEGRDARAGSRAARGL